MKKIMSALLIALIGAAVSSAISHAGETGKVRIKMATLYPRGSAGMTIIDKMRKEINKKTNGDVDLKVYWGGVQGDENDIIRKIRLGQVHGGVFTGVGLSKIVPECRVTELPYVFRNYDEVTYVRGKLQETMEEYFRKAGYEVIGWGEVGFVYNFSKVPITSVEILRKQKCWVWGDDPLAHAVFDALGVTPVPLSFQDVLTSLSAKLIDTAATTPFGAVAFRWHTRFNYMNENPVVNVTGGMIVRNDMWEKISKGNQMVVKKISKDYNNVLIETSREENRESLGVLKKAGIQIVHSENPEVSLKFLMDAGKKARESLVGKLYSRELLDRTLAYLQEYRKSHPESAYPRLQ